MHAGERILQQFQTLTASVQSAGISGLHALSINCATWFPGLWQDPFPLSLLSLALSANHLLQISFVIPRELLQICLVLFGKLFLLCLLSIVTHLLVSYMLPCLRSHF